MGVRAIRRSLNLPFPFPLKQEGSDAGVVLLPRFVQHRAPCYCSMNVNIVLGSINPTITTVLKGTTAPQRLSLLM